MPVTLSLVDEGPVAQASQTVAGRWAPRSA